MKNDKIIKEKILIICQLYYNYKNHPQDLEIDLNPLFRFHRSVT